MYEMDSSPFGEGSGSVFISDLGCTGTEEDLLQCSHTVNIGSGCSHERDVGLRCERKPMTGLKRPALHCIQTD